MRMRSRKPAAFAAAIALLAAAAGARADIAPPSLDGCAVRPLGSPCFVDGETRGVCAEQILTFQNGNQHREVVCRVAAPGVDPGAATAASASAPATGSAPAPGSATATAPGSASATAPGSAPAPAPQVASCAAGQGGQGAARGLAAAMTAAAFVIAGAARRRATRTTARPGPR